MSPVSMCTERLLYKFVVIFTQGKKLQVSKKLSLSPPKKFQAEEGFFLRQKRL